MPSHGTRAEFSAKRQHQNPKINSHKYYYLNYRDGDKVRSDYLRADEVEVMRAKINRRHELVAALKEQRRSQKQIEKTLGRVPNVE